MQLCYGQKYRRQSQYITTWIICTLQGQFKKDERHKKKGRGINCIEDIKRMWWSLINVFKDWSPTTQSPMARVTHNQISHILRRGNDYIIGSTRND